MTSVSNFITNANGVNYMVRLGFYKGLFIFLRDVFTYRKRVLELICRDYNPVTELQMLGTIMSIMRIIKDHCMTNPKWAYYASKIGLEREMEAVQRLIDAERNRN